MNNKITSLPAVPLITHDPFFSIWDCGYTPTSSDTRHWSGVEKRLRGTISVDGYKMSFLGVGANPPIQRVACEITPLSTTYRFESRGISLEVKFTSPLLLDDFDILSTPITYVDFDVKFIDGKNHKVEINMLGFETIVYSGEIGPKLRCDFFSDELLNYAYLGQMNQRPLSSSGDHTTIDWGYLFFAAKDGLVDDSPGALTNAIRYNVKKEEPFSSTLMIGYDDISSINYFGTLLPAYYARNGKTITQALREFCTRENEIKQRCEKFDRELLENAHKIGGEDYQLIVSASYRQSISAHKLVADNKGDILFISKENDSNGCAATVDITYPSTPLFLLYNPELVRGMLRPILKFARMPVWKYDFAPHDAGRYPVLNGQIYGAQLRNKSYMHGDTVAPYYLYPDTVDAYKLSGQMPVEECGNMLITIYSTCFADGDFSMAKDNLDLLEKWSKYLIEFGEDPGEQLCTDDFAGHLARNVNLSAKAVMGIASYSKILEALGEGNSAVLMWNKAKEMAESWLERAYNGEYSYLSFSKDGWSQKYNLVWDKLFGWELLPESFYKNELESYLPKINEYGLPLDSRAQYTKSDWTAWCASMTDDRKVFDALMKPIAKYLRDRRSPVPFSDFYDTIEGVYVHFIGRSVQGGMFMPLLMEKWKQN
ncbi:MAG: DUF4965 domain-containing protein [Clostridia bacterium]|nr:DUF4965 domain-containing protein [Clostridia bacterium]